MDKINQIGELLTYLFWPLFLTIIVETVVGWIVVKKRSYIKTFFIINVMTNPLMNLLLCLFVSILSFPYGITLFILEAFVWAFEAYLIRIIHKVTVKKAIFISCLVNFSSYMTGVLLGI